MERALLGENQELDNCQFREDQEKICWLKQKQLDLIETAIDEKEKVKYWLKLILQICDNILNLDFYFRKYTCST